MLNQGISHSQKRLIKALVPATMTPLILLFLCIAESDAIVESSLDLENQLSLEVQDTFSFLDSQDAWLGDSLESDQPWKSLHTASDFAVRETDDFSAMDDDMGSGFMNEMMGESWQVSNAGGGGNICIVPKTADLPD